MAASRSDHGTASEAKNRVPDQLASSQLSESWTAPQLHSRGWQPSTA
eukprot:CAMPEP_0183460372 /NCGR_PEP_ID=MMETSP0370-20130417/137477_1 /TAXON_ID=268820 /ORGANISM="Peridinium aciculiferum, Strain PAER-2" /LENGTH=46 /DNA_ID= /DNA_START= /DNA_END= /DNA_ORIENTATION=